MLLENWKNNNTSKHKKKNSYIFSACSRDSRHIVCPFWFPAATLKNTFPTNQKWWKKWWKNDEKMMNKWWTNEQMMKKWWKMMKRKDNFFAIFLQSVVSAPFCPSALTDSPNQFTPIWMQTVFTRTLSFSVSFANPDAIELTIAALNPTFQKKKKTISISVEKKIIKK